MYTDQCLCIQISVWVYRSVFMYTEQCLGIQISVYVYRPVFQYTDQCHVYRPVCGYTDQCYVYRAVFMYTDQCLCMQINVYVYRTLFMYTDLCLRTQTSVSQNVHLSVTSPRLYGRPQTNKRSNVKNKTIEHIRTQQNTSPCGIWSEWIDTGIFIYRWRYVMLPTGRVFT